MSTFPDARWGSENSKLRRPMIWFGSTHAGSWVIRTLTPLDRYVIERSHGRYTALGPMGAPTMLLTTTGAVSGQTRTTPLLFARDGDDILVAGSNFGQAHHPAWTKNLIVHPDAIVTVGGKAVPVTAELLAGDEARAGFQNMIEVVPVYAEYRNRTDRAIRVFRLRARQSV
jgi:deazaflavin-dependent oxidoreductase (nitroreductase family)